jgi:HEXXH motif-containing protein
VKADFIVWSDTSFYDRLHEKTATALIAAAAALRSRRPLAGDEEEFLDLYGVMESGDPEIFTQVWRDPYGYFWARHAFELVGWILSGTAPPRSVAEYLTEIGKSDPQAALKFHLEEFKRFGLALAIIRGGRLHFRSPWEAALPFSIPGTRLAAVGKGIVRIAGVADGALEVIREGRTVCLRPDDPSDNPDDPSVVTRPLIRLGDCELTLKPEAFILPRIEAAAALTALPDDLQERLIPMTEEALRLVERHLPDAFNHICEFIRVIAFKPPQSGDYSNISYSDLPGSFVLGAMGEPYWIADGLVHETFHNRLFCILEDRPILVEPDDAPGPSEFYSPFRDDLRPLTGLLHALYVFTQVCRFWLAVWASGETRGSRRAYVEDQAVRVTLQIRITLSQLRRFARFTQFGAELFDQLAKDVEAATIRMKRLGLRLDAPAMLVRPDGEIVVGGLDSDQHPLSIVETVRRHAARHDVRKQCSELESILRIE